MTTKRVLKKIGTPFEALEATGAILVINLVDPQVQTMRVFEEAIETNGLRHLCVANKLDRVEQARVDSVRASFGDAMIAASMRTGEGVDLIRQRIAEAFLPGDRIAVLGVFNSGKTSLIKSLTGEDLEVGDIPGTTLSFTSHAYDPYTLVDTVGQVIDINRPMMVSVDLSDCETRADRLARVIRQDAEGILASLETALEGLGALVEVIRDRLDQGGKLVVAGAGASALVAMEMGGQGMETGVPVLVYTNNFADSQPVSFSKGTGEEEGGLARYALLAVNPEDTVIGISASGGTGFVYDILRRAREKGATTAAITENPDTPLGKAADWIVKSNAKPEGPSSSKIQAAHLAIAHALLVTLADERGVTAEESIGFMLPETVRTKKMGIK
jgi:D-arabinose 5-phosphate isomerase GutQ/GTP-binding protein EngB required for normal cell division